ARPPGAARQPYGRPRRGDLPMARRQPVAPARGRDLPGPEQWRRRVAEDVAGGLLRHLRGSSRRAAGALSLARLPPGPRQGGRTGDIAARPATAYLDPDAAAASRGVAAR